METCSFRLAPTEPFPETFRVLPNARNQKGALPAGDLLLDAPNELPSDPFGPRTSGDEHFVERQNPPTWSQQLSSGS